jgi:hypothetical protein
MTTNEPNVLEGVARKVGVMLISLAAVLVWALLAQEPAHAGESFTLGESWAESSLALLPG